MPLLRAYTPKHAKPSKLAPAVVAGGMAAGLAVADATLLTGAAAAAAPNSSWDRLAQCESGGNWSINTGNGYYGGLQFDLATWRSVGGKGRPDQASRTEQIQRANLLHDARGFRPWPACSRKLDLNSSSAASARVAPRASRSTRPAAAARQATGKAPAFEGHVLSVADVGRYRASVAQWQRQMRNRGWRIAVDGRFGRQSAGIAQRFAAEKGLRPARRGTVDKAVWNAAWSAPVT